MFFLMEDKIREKRLEAKMRKSFTFIFILLVLVLFGCKTEAAELKTGIGDFPASYQPYLRELEKKHPNWTFSALYTNLEWNTVVANENVFGKNLVPKSYSDRWKNTKPGEYNVEVDGNWVDSSKQAIEYTMDPRNFLNNVRIFQFEKLSYEASSNIARNIEKILYGTEFYQSKVNYLDENGKRIYTNKTYAELIENGAKISGVSAFNLASRIKQEVGPFLSHKSISGDVDGYRGLYNFYNIGATSGTGQLEAIKKGLQFARNGNGANQTTQNRYVIPWNSKERAITGGGIFIGTSYINRGQNNIYLQKFHVSDNSNRNLFWHQYMTNVLAPYSESKSVHTGYVNSNLIDSGHNFIIPIYNNMPERPIESPNINPNEYIDDNTQVIANVSTTLNVRSGPGTSYESIIQVARGEKMTRISKGNGNGELWDRVILQSGIIGYVFQAYTVVAIDSSEISFDTSLKVEDNQISGLNENTVSKIKTKVNTQYSTEIRNVNGVILQENELVGTGARLNILNADGAVVAQYTFILYGDVNGDGKISSVDLLVMRRHILEMQRLENVFYKAGNVRKNGKSPSSIDCLLVQRHILGLKPIAQ